MAPIIIQKYEVGPDILRLDPGSWVGCFRFSSVIHVLRDCIATGNTWTTDEKRRQPDKDPELGLRVSGPTLYLRAKFLIYGAAGHPLRGHTTRGHASVAMVAVHAVVVACCRAASCGTARPRCRLEASQAGRVTQVVHPIPKTNFDLFFNQIFVWKVRWPINRTAGRSWG